MKILADLRKNEQSMEPKVCSVDDVVELSTVEFNNLQQNLMRDRKFIERRRDSMFIKDAVQHCLLVLGEGGEDGILIQSQGRNYPMRTAFISNARTIINVHIRMLADYIISEGTEYAENGEWMNSYEELYNHFGAQITNNNGNGKMLVEELKRRREVKGLTVDEDGINVKYHPKYCNDIEPTDMDSQIVKAPISILEDKYNVKLVATYEELMEVPFDKRLTEYFGDLSLYNYKYGVTEEQILPLYKTALETIEMSETEFLADKDLNQYRFEIVARMRDVLIAKTLLTGEEVLFVNSEPIPGEEDFGYKAGFVVEIDRENKTCTINGTYFKMENVPLHNVLGKCNPNIQGLHYGYRNVEPLYGEDNSIAQFYIYKSKNNWESLKGCCAEKTDLNGLDDSSELLEDCGEDETAGLSHICGMNINL